jgi:P27 family predicted phage terminase small subunit
MEPSLAKKRKPTRPTPPPDITGESLEEWNRVCGEIESADRELKPQDRALLVLYCRTWGTFHTAYEQVKKWGPVIKYANGVPGQSPSYKVCKELGPQLVKMMEQLGATPASRKFDVATESKAPEPPPLEF